MFKDNLKLGKSRQAQQHLREEVEQEFNEKFRDAARVFGNE